MKPFLTLATAAAVLLGFSVMSAPATAVPVGWTGPVKEDPQPLGPWEARVRWLQGGYYDSPMGPIYYQYTYMTITGSTQQYCQNQLASVAASGNVQVVEFCHPV
jgi:hypothetical protein